MTVPALSTRRPSVTRYSADTSKTLERWDNELRSRGAIGSPVPIHAVPALRRARDEIIERSAPSTAEVVEARLMQLRSSTIIRNETAEEAEASVRVMCVQLAEVPDDILRQACDLYTRAPGPRHFPRSAGELLAFVNPIRFDRASTAHRLRLMIAEAERAEQERNRLSDNGHYTTAEFSALLPSMRVAAVKRGWATQEMLDQITASEAASCQAQAGLGAEEIDHSPIQGERP